MTQVPQEERVKTVLGIRTTLLGLIGLVVLTAVGISSISLVFLARQKQDGWLINKAGAQRMLSQSIAKNAAIMAMGKDVGARKELQENQEHFSAALELLLDGDLSAKVKPAMAELKAGLKLVQQLWQPIQSQYRKYFTLSGAEPRIF